QPRYSPRPTFRDSVRPATDACSIMQMRRLPIGERPSVCFGAWSMCAGAQTALWPALKFPFQWEWDPWSQGHLPEDLRPIVHSGCLYEFSSDHRTARVIDCGHPDPHGTATAELHRCDLSDHHGSVRIV